MALRNRRAVCNTYRVTCGKSNETLLPGDFQANVGGMPVDVALSLLGDFARVLERSGGACVMCFPKASRPRLNELLIPV